MSKTVTETATLDDFDGPDILGESVPYLLHRISSLMEVIIDSHLKDADLSMDMWRVLYILSHVGDHSLVDLSRVTSVNTSTLSRLVSRMVDRKLISKKRSDRDNRTVEVTILSAGQEIVTRLSPYAQNAHELADGAFSQTELPVLKTYLRRLYRTLQENAG